MGLTVLALGCGGSSSGVPGVAAQCNATLGGAVPGTLSCGSVAATFDGSKNQSTIGFASSAAGRTQFGAVFVLAGEPRVGSVAMAGTTQGQVSVDTPNGSWLAFNDSTGSQGSYTLTLSSVALIGSSGTTKAYAVTGTLDATVPSTPGSGASGTVTVHATF